VSYNIDGSPVKSEYLKSPLPDDNFFTTKLKLGHEAHIIIFKIPIPI
jgi:hypothetical protein